MQILWNNKYKNSCRSFQERSPVPPPGGADDEVCHHHHHLLDQLTTTNLNPTSTVSSPTRSQLQSQLASQMQGMGATDQMQVLQSLQHMAGRKQKEVRKIIFHHFSGIFTNLRNKIESFLGGFHNLVLSGSSCLFLSPESGSGLTRRHFLPTFKASTAQTLYCILKRAEY